MKTAATGFWILVSGRLRFGSWEIVGVPKASKSKPNKTRTLERDLAGAGEAQAARDVMAERERQKSVEGWTEAHDDQHQNGELAEAAQGYATAYLFPGKYKPNFPSPDGWPWAESWWKPKDPRRNLVRAAALIVAEIERLDRAALRLGGKATEQGEGSN